jgi:hypothetical protein
MVDCQSAGGGSTSPRERMNDEPVEVFEVIADEWDSICLKHLRKLGITAEELKAKHDEDNLNHAEFKVWMLVSASRLI